MKMTARFMERYPMTAADYLELEGFKPQRKESIGNRMVQMLIHQFVHSGEPKITLKGNLGHQYWTVYDPGTQQSATLATEQEVRIWLEQRYSR
jgi:hypothetical protein